MIQRKKIPIRQTYVSCHDDRNLNGHNMSLSYCIISRTLQQVVIRVWIWILVLYRGDQFN